jgi:RNA polymerase sigma factor (sigma-70 family)
MATSQVSEVIRHLRRTVLLRDAAVQTDGQLLEGFISRREEAALTVLVQRHGPMVWGVCRRVLHNYHDAEDAFQATFLVLVRKAASIVPREMVVNWLHGVAHQTALKARATAAKRKARERQVTEMPDLETRQDHQLDDLQLLLDQELSCLPQKYRVVLLLCDLEDKTRTQAAQQLGVPEGTVAGRLARARVMLAKRLARHGLAVSGGAVALAISNNAASACVPAPLLMSTIQAATLVAANHAATGVVSASVAALTEGVLKAMFMTKLKFATAIVVAMVALLGVGRGLYPTSAAAPPDRNEQVVQDPAVEKPTANGEGVKKLTLPQGPPPMQVLVSLEKTGKLVVKSAHMIGFAIPPLPPANKPGPLPAPVPGGFGGIGLVKPGTIGSHTFDLIDVKVLDTTGKKVDKMDLAKLLKEETVAMASFGGRELDPLHLRVLKEGTLVFILPNHKLGAFPPGFQPLPHVPGNAIPLPGPPAPPVPPEGAVQTEKAKK